MFGRKRALAVLEGELAAAERTKNHLTFEDARLKGALKVNASRLVTAEARADGLRRAIRAVGGSVPVAE